MIAFTISLVGYNVNGMYVQHLALRVDVRAITLLGVSWHTRLWCSALAGSLVYSIHYYTGHSYDIQETHFSSQAINKDIRCNLYRNTHVSMRPPSPGIAVFVVIF